VGSGGGGGGWAAAGPIARKGERGEKGRLASWAARGGWRLGQKKEERGKEEKKKGFSFF
jgi:hypothetical protein